MRGFRGMGISYPTDQLMPGDSTLWGGPSNHMNPALLPGAAPATAPAGFALTGTQVAMIAGGALVVLYLLLRRN